ncbi:putative disease resistance protein [Vitis vinifera]|uniref:Putative disease resistance protein n=1 Tax=Vitis vinifera TaxID=29760 RepID=A0A438G9Y6_VITVI|nr:putative disease resistance protein [Vitis vinifera]
MGNVFSVSISTNDIAGYCDCTAARANYICKLAEHRVTLRTELQKLRELKNDVNRKVDVAERQQMKRLDQVQGWLSRVEAMETEVGQLIGDGAETIEEKRLRGFCHPKHCISSYTLGKKVARKLQDMATLRAKDVILRWWLILYLQLLWRKYPADPLWAWNQHLTKFAGVSKKNM